MKSTTDATGIPRRLSGREKAPCYARAPILLTRILILASCLATTITFAEQPVQHSDVIVATVLERLSAVVEPDCQIVHPSAAVVSGQQGTVCATLGNLMTSSSLAAARNSIDEVTVEMARERGYAARSTGWSLRTAPPLGTVWFNAVAIGNDAYSFLLSPERSFLIIIWDYTHR